MQSLLVKVHIQPQLVNAIVSLVTSVKGRADNVPHFWVYVNVNVYDTHFPPFAKTTGEKWYSVVPTR